MLVIMNARLPITHSQSSCAGMGDLVEGVGTSSPPGEEDGEANRLEDSGESTYSYGVEWTFLSHNLRDNLLHRQQLNVLNHIVNAERTHRRSSGGEEDQRTKIGCAFVAEGTSRVDQSTNAIGLNGGPDERTTPGGSGSGSLL